MADEWIFLQPQWLMAIPLPLLLWLLEKQAWIKWSSLSSSGAHEPVSVKHPYAHQLHQHQLTQQATGSHTYLYGVTWFLLLLALAQPVIYGARLSHQPQPVDLTLIIDTSVSMVLDDYEIQGKRVDRMTMAKALLDRFAERFRGRKLGIVVFGDQSYVLLQPSEDRNLVRHLLSRLRTTMAGRQAAIGDAIAIASRDSQLMSDTSDKVLVLITDAVQPVGTLSPQDGARQAAEAGIVLHTIAIGATEHAAADDSFGKLIYEPADTSLLKELATITGGNYFHATDSHAMDQALNKIEARHREKNNEAGPKLRQAMYIWPLAAAILLLILINIMPTRRKVSA